MRLGHRELPVDVLQDVDHPQERGRREVDRVDEARDLGDAPVDRRIDDGRRASSAARLRRPPSPSRHERLDRELLRLRRRLLAVGQLAQLAVELRDLLEVPEDRLDAVRRARVDLVGLLERGRGELQEAAGDVLVLLGRLDDLQDLVEDDAVRREGAVDLRLAVLDAAGDRDLALAVEELHGAHLAQVHPDRVVRLLDGRRVGRRSSRSRRPARPSSSPSPGRRRPRCRSRRTGCRSRPALPARSPAPRASAW